MFILTDQENLPKVHQQHKIYSIITQRKRNRQIYYYTKEVNRQILLQRRMLCRRFCFINVFYFLYISARLRFTIMFLVSKPILSTR